MWVRLLLFVVLRYSYGFTEDAEDVIVKFNMNLIQHLGDELARLDSDGKVDQLSHKLGVVAMYFRIFKELVPVNGGKGYPHLYPELQDDLHSELGTVCAASLNDCTDYILEYLRPVHPWLYSDQFESMEMSIEMFQKLINDNLLSLEISATQIMCFFTTNKLDVFEYLPFCDYVISNNSGSIVWPGGQFKKSPNYLDALKGDSYKCAMKSFCPDPCCSDVAPKSLEFTERSCQLNVCKRPEKCSITPNLNINIESMRTNDWNISCLCTAGTSFRADVGQCVHDNKCSKENLCKDGEECVTTMTPPGYKCMCQLGYIKSRNGTCLPIQRSHQHWDGLARRERSKHAALHQGTVILPLILITVWQAHICNKCFINFVI